MYRHSASSYVAQYLDIKLLVFLDLLDVHKYILAEVDTNFYQPHDNMYPPRHMMDSRSIMNCKQMTPPPIIMMMLCAKLGSNKYQFCMSLVSLRWESNFRSPTWDV